MLFVEAILLYGAKKYQLIELPGRSRASKNHADETRRRTNLLVWKNVSVVRVMEGRMAIVHDI
jgi:hypothetical protein